MKFRFRGHFVGGEFRASHGPGYLKEDPGNWSHPVGGWKASAGREVDRALAAASDAFLLWRRRPLFERIRLVKRYQGALRRRRSDIAFCIARETGKPWSEAVSEAGALVEKVDVTLKEALPLVADRRFPLKAGGQAALRYKPRGVAAIIGPYNVPAHLPNGQIVPAILTGNTVVFKPSEQAPFTGQILAECWRDSGVPAGVFNLVQGKGDVGAQLAADSRVKVVLFTGSYATGQKLKNLCEKREECPLLALEMGGKNAALVLPDAPLEAAVEEIIHGAFATSGQRCSSTSRVLVHRKAARRFIPLFLKRLKTLRVGYFSEEPFMGPLISEEAVERFLNAQKTARRLGFKALAEGKRISDRKGHYVSPSVHLWDKPWREPQSRSYWDEELFGPDVAVYVLGSLDEMARLNNASRYGLAASVFTRSKKSFEYLFQRLDNGVVHLNRTTAMTPGSLPFGGVKRSGNFWPAGLFVPYICTVPVASVEL